MIETAKWDVLLRGIERTVGSDSLLIYELGRAIGRGDQPGIARALARLEAYPPAMRRTVEATLAMWVIEHAGARIAQGHASARASA